jgi:hypothetical protein
MGHRIVTIGQSKLWYKDFWYPSIIKLNSPSFFRLDFCFIIMSNRNIYISSFCNDPAGFDWTRILSIPGDAMVPA